MQLNITTQTPTRSRRSWALSGVSAGLLGATALAAALLAGLSGFTPEWIFPEWISRG
jgi:hypothetical protein